MTEQDLDGHKVIITAVVPESARRQLGG